MQDSLAAEIEGTMRKELQMDDPDVEEQRYTQSETWFILKRTFRLMVIYNLV